MHFFFSSRRRHTRYIGDWSSDVCSSDLSSSCRAATGSPPPERGPPSPLRPSGTPAGSLEQRLDLAEQRVLLHLQPDPPARARQLALELHAPVLAALGEIGRASCTRRQTG